jgi:pilus assembly protein Flp/PilA
VVGFSFVLTTTQVGLCPLHSVSLLEGSANFGDTPMYNLVKRFRRDQEGAALAEYGLLIALIAVVCVVAITALGSQVNIAFSTIASQLQAAL